MERLTFDGLFCDIAKCKETPGGPFCESGSCSQRKVWERLKEYEDKGVEPDMIEATINGQITLQKALEKYTQAEEQGRLMMLPCSMGSTIYMIVTKHTKGREPFSFIKTTELMESNVFRVCRDFGKTVFLTREEAERALEGRR